MLEKGCYHWFFQTTTCSIVKFSFMHPWLRGNVDHNRDSMIHRLLLAHYWIHRLLSFFTRPSQTLPLALNNPHSFYLFESSKWVLLPSSYLSIEWRIKISFYARELQKPYEYLEIEGMMIIKIKSIIFRRRRRRRRHYEFESRDLTKIDNWRSAGTRWWEIRLIIYWVIFRVE